MNALPIQPVHDIKNPEVLGVACKCARVNCRNTFRARGPKRYCSKRCRKAMSESRRTGVIVVLREPTDRVCARESCQTLFRAIGPKKFCSRRCAKAVSHARWIMKYPEKQKNRNAKSYRRRKKRGVSTEEFERRIKEQNNLCPIGKHPFSEKRGLGGNNPSLDHDHATGKNRGIICQRHNLALGGFGDSPETLEDAIEYVLSWRRIPR